MFLILFLILSLFSVITPQSLNHLVELKCGGVSLILIKHIVLCLFVLRLIHEMMKKLGHLEQRIKKENTVHFLISLFSYFEVHLSHWGQCLT